MEKQGTVLVVDDDKGMRDMLKDVFELEDYEVAVAIDGRQAILLAKEQPFDVVVMDIKMPGMNGVEAMIRIKEMSPQTPVIMLSAFAFEDIVRDSLKRGAFAALSKPIDFDKLFFTINQACGRGGRVLVADDDAATCRIVKLNLEGKGYQVDVVSDGQQAVAKAREGGFSAILLDMKMPVMNGIEAYRAIAEINPEAFVVFITGYPDELPEMNRGDSRRGPCISITKPINFDHLFKIIEEHARQA